MPAGLPRIRSSVCSVRAHRLPEIVWQYGRYGAPGRAADYLDNRHGRAAPGSRGTPLDRQSPDPAGR